MGQLMKLLQSMIKEQPGAKEMLKKMVDDADVSTAAASPSGLGDALTASSARASPDDAASPTSPVAPVLSTTSPPAAAGDPTTPPPGVTPLSIVPARVNSSTCRNQHARLQRRMLSCDPAHFPHMSKLWHGNRAD